MIIPNIWKNKKNVPNHQPVITCDLTPPKYIKIWGVFMMFAPQATGFNAPH